jgi:hypothetical protein
MSSEAKPPRNIDNTPLKLRGNSLFDWTVWAITDIADNVADLNKSLGKGDNQAVVNDLKNLISLRRWAFILPGGGKLRGGRRVKAQIRRAVPPFPSTVTPPPQTGTTPPPPPGTKPPA